MFFPEMLVDPEWCRGKRFLDAGSGNGRLTESVAQFGGMVVGVDYSTSVYAAERRRARPGVHFVRGDLQTPPFAPGTFDLIFSNGVLHHTPSTRATFRAVAALASPAGRFYVWLYKSIPESRRADVIRFVVSRLPPRLQHAFVVSWVSARTMLSVVKRGGYRLQPLAERRLHIYDLYTPRWRHYHTPIEVAEWYHDCGFGPPTLTHWNSPCGFGMVAQKGIFEDTPGPHFGQRPRAPAWLMRSEERRAR
jgi:SAM-dependent methyltransferase